jgi:hypothetical protein
MIISFKTEDKDPEKDDSYKTNAKFVNNMILEKFPKLKIIYYRSEKYTGHLAVSGHKLDKE